MKRTMPPLNHLRAFEAAVRHQSFTHAAEELNVTQGAISRHIRTLEDHLGFPLFERANNSLNVPPQSQRFADVLTAAFDSINKASQALVESRRRTVLTLHGYTNFLIRWLAPRLPAFHAQHPGIEIRLSAGREEVDFARDPFDVAIRYGGGNWPLLHKDLLFRTEIVPICTPKAAQSLETKGPAGLLDLPIYHVYARRHLWPEWFSLVSQRPFAPRQEVFSEDMVVMHECVLAGMGVALSPRQYVDEDVACGRLVVPFDTALTHPAGFYFVCPPQHMKIEKIALFHRWLMGAIDRPRGESAANQAHARQPPMQA